MCSFKLRFSFLLSSLGVGCIDHSIDRYGPSIVVLLMHTGSCRSELKGPNTQVLFNLTKSFKKQLLSLREQSRCSLALAGFPDTSEM